MYSSSPEMNWNALDENKDTAREKLERAFELLALETFLEEDETEEVKKIPYVCVLNALSDYYVTAKEGKSNLVFKRCDRKFSTIQKIQVDKCMRP